MIRIALLLCITALAACGARQDGLRDLRSNTAGPDDFSTVPSRPLDLPPSFSDLPPPTPGAGNRADVDPIADAARALGGRPGAGVSDPALVAHASRFGRDAGIRATLFAEDERFRTRRGRLSLPFARGDRYFAAYAGQALDAAAETRRFRAAGVDVPAAPPRR
ncbi:MAG: DUF3035 domain-containing protein [Shimia sp.]